MLMTVLSQNPYGAGGPVLEHGALYGPLVASGEWWRLVSGAFLHAGIFHLGMNMLLLWFLSQELEPALGRLRFAVLYVVSLLGGALGVMVLDPLAPTVGASGAVFGLMGALIVLQLRAKQNPWQSGIGGLVALNLVLTFLIPGISIGGHIGGLVAGRGSRGPAATAALAPGGRRAAHHRRGRSRRDLPGRRPGGRGHLHEHSTAVAAAGGRRPRPRPDGLSARTARPGSSGWCARRGAGPVVPRRAPIGPPKYHGNFSRSVHTKRV